MRMLSALAMATAAALIGGCGGAVADAGNFEKPTIAVMKFENRAPFPLGWKIGDGTADILVDRLVATGRYQVVERPELAAVQRELNLQNSGATRVQGRSEKGRLKNAQYLIKGTVTDFGHVSTSRGFFGGGGWDIFGGGNRAIMCMTMYVVDVESGQIICSESIEESVRARDVSVEATYKGVAFGGSSFYRTPLGEATTKVIERAVRRITEVIAAQPWEPRVAMVEPGGTLIINGGVDRGLCVGQEYDVVDAGQPVIDPKTGDLLGYRSAATIGRIRITGVQERYSTAAPALGDSRQFQVGQRCIYAAAATRYSAAH
jgi:curli biogenesis system outer membrane secretion channel CsgG